MPTSGILRVRTRSEDLEVSFSLEKYSGRSCGARSLTVAKRHQPVDIDYVIFSKYYEDVRAEMLKANYSAISKNVDMAKQAEQMGFTAQECAAVIIRNRHKKR